MALAKPQRQHRIVGLLAAQAVTSQAHLVELLAAEGVTATQATVSRDLEDLGAIKVRVAAGDTVSAIPALPAEQRAHEDHLDRKRVGQGKSVSVSVATGGRRNTKK